MRKVTLTFDNGPEPGVTERVLETLRVHGILATFFVVGEKIEKPEVHALATLAHEQGHWIGNHTYSHSQALGLTPDRETPAREIGRTQRLIGELAHRRRFFRPAANGGRLDRNLLSRAAVDFLTEGAYTCVLWNCVPGDWMEPAKWSERALADCRRQDWTVVVLHDLPTGAMDHLDGFIARLTAEGFEFSQEFPPACIPIVEGRPT